MPPEEYSYSFMAKNINLLWIVLTLTLFSIFIVYLVFTVETPNYKGVLIISAVLIPLVALALYGHLRRSKYLSKILLDGNGIFCPTKEIKGNLSKMNNSDLIKWSDIEKIEPFSYPDNKSVAMEKKSGVKLITKHKEAIIYENIDNYCELITTIRSRAELTRK